MNNADEPVDPLYISSFTSYLWAEQVLSLNVCGAF